MGRIRLWHRLHKTIELKRGLVAGAVVLGMLLTLVLTIVDMLEAFHLTGLLTLFIVECALVCMFFSPNWGAPLVGLCGVALTCARGTLGVVNPGVIVVLLVSACVVWGHTQLRLDKALMGLGILMTALCVNTYLRERELFIFGLIVYSVICVLPWLAGRSLKGQIIARELLQNRYELSRVREQLACKERDEVLAHKIHDSVTCDLSAVLLLCEQMDKSADVLTIRQGVEKRVVAALNSVHEVIDLLDGQREESNQKLEHDVNERRLDIRLRRLCSEKDEELHILGYKGTSVVRSIPLIVEERMREVIESFIYELYTNIVRHCSIVSDEYSLIIDIRRENVHILQTNSVKDGVRYIQGIRSGYGLKMHRAEIESLGGHCSIISEGDMWMVNCQIPTLLSSLR